ADGVGGVGRVADDDQVDLVARDQALRSLAGLGRVGLAIDALDLEARLLAVDHDVLCVEGLHHALGDEGVGGGEWRERPGLRADVADQDVAGVTPSPAGAPTSAAAATAAGRI